ncbi:hypothetical protein [Patulibacter sp. SYSU D01012]|uniref:hypothetical protein n=1 Tax=Patulibacter sp. SYSU D01012 TaxID=2817381 RepID=UPI001B31083D|nr:hypothetical protein [Patulibacter sp. SYSU D01012]
MSVPRNQPTPPTRVQPSAPAPAAPAPASALDLKTLIISALSSAAAAFVFSHVWAPGTLTSAALSPVIVALVREALNKPTEAVSAVLPTPRRAVRRRGDGDTPLAPPTPTEAMHHGGADGYGTPPTAATRAHDPYAAHDPVGAGAADAPVTVYAVRKPLRHRWRLAIVTGLLGFVIAAVLITVPELVTGSSATGGGGTTLFHNGSSRSTTPPATTTTTTAPTKTTTTTKTITRPAQTVTETTEKQTVPDEPTGPDAAQQEQRQGTTSRQDAAPPATPTQPPATTPAQPQAAPGTDSGAVTP